MEHCTPLVREAHFEVKMRKTPQLRGTSRSWDVEKVHAVVARSTFPMLGPLLEVDMSKKCTPLWREAHFQVNMLKTQKRTTCSDHFWTFRCRFAWQAQGILHLPKSEQNSKVLQQFKNVGRRGTCEQDLQRCMSRGRRNNYKRHVHQRC